MRPGGHRSDDPTSTRYSRLRECGRLVFLAGISARRPDNTVPGVSTDETGAVRFDVGVQTSAALDNLDATLREVGLSLADVVDVTSFLVDMKDYGDYVAAWNQHFGDSVPARTTVGVQELPDPLLRIELKAIACRPD